MADEPVLRVADLNASFLGEDGWQQVVHDVAFEVAAKETLALVGESGSGKSVSALAILRLLPPTTSRVTGSVHLGNEPLHTLSDAAIRKIRGDDIAMIFQEPMTSLNPVLTIGDQIAEALILHRGATRREAIGAAVRLLDRVRIPRAAARVHDYPHQFSGGMRQRVMIAMAIACQPKLLIADEPTTALDVTIQAQILALLKELQEEFGMSLLFITHDMGVVAETADRVAVMHRGRLVETGPVVELFQRPSHVCTCALLAAVPRLGSMAGHDRPQRFAAVDMATGAAEVPREVEDTVQHAAPPVLELKNLTTRFDIRSGLLRRVRGRVHAVENVSFTLKPGETLALVGESGCGKSTTARSITGLVKPSSGSIVIDGIEVFGRRGASYERARKHVQMVFQDPFASLNPRMKVGSAIAEPLRVHSTMNERKVRERVESLLQRVGLDPAMARRFPHEFSGGQRQRICIARALALEPKLLVADECVSALDVSVKAQVLNLMLDLQVSLKLSYLFISHDMAVVERVSHRVAVMYVGEIVEIGPRAQIFEDPRHPYTKKLLAAVPVPDPMHRRTNVDVSREELPSAERPLDFVLPGNEFIEVAPDHLVLQRKTP
ncbi:MAG TPA: ABC transporter ATP-binding protein [Thermoanaerobaculia bacterium]|nr:ABC transporter ATP-binding protein [Thermoanaerobaculia bacterium]